MVTQQKPGAVAAKGTGLVLLTLASAQFLMTLDSSVMNVSIATVAEDLGIGALASQLGAVTVSAVPEEESSEVGGLQNTALNLGASLATALVGSVLIATLTSLFLQGVLDHPNIPDSLKSQAQVTFGAGVPFLSDTAVRNALEANGVDASTTQAVLEVNADARLAALRAALFVVVLVAAFALFFTRWIPTMPPGTPAVVPKDLQVRDSQGQPQ